MLYLNIIFYAVMFTMVLAYGAKAEVHYNDYYIEDGKRVYYNETTEVTIEQKFEPASGVEVYKITPVTISNNYKSLVDDGGSYNASEDVYKPDLEFPKVR